MAVTWTKEQRQAIDLRGSNLLVSAAAGSGKTAVLVERILQLITDKENPVDIDRILVVTFTKAAAAEMRERVGLALDRLREENPKDANLLRQSSLIHNAMITTIDSFCLFVVRNYFEEIGLDPNFRIAEEGEIKLLELDVLDAVFEAQYTGENREAFLGLIDAYAGKKNTQSVKDMVSKIYRMSAASPWPKTWVGQISAVYGTLEGGRESTPFLQEVCRYAGRMVSDIRQQLKGLHALTLEPDGPDRYEPALAADMEILAGAENLEGYGQFQAFFAGLKLGNLAPVRNFGGDIRKKEAVQNGRNRIKKELEELKTKYFARPEEEIREQMGRLCPIAEELVRITLCYMDAMDKEKRRKRIMDFGDIEHFALQILVDEGTGKSRHAAEEFRRHFAEIMVDEYQDSNQVQEVILRAISGEEEGIYNMFMVGDVKQSIYRFRLARPELFMEKYRLYHDVEEKPDSRTIRIELHRNFRSRREVLSFTNDMFYKIMSRDLGEVTYDDAAALYPGADFEACEGRQAEVLLMDVKDTLSGEEAEEDKKGLEARMVAGKIKELMGSMEVSDKETGELRPLRYSDIVILFRSLKDWGPAFAEVLSAAGIPAHVESSTGYFAAIEVQTVLNMLRILDNPYQDIPMAAVLKSPMVGLSDEEMAEIRLSDAGVPFAAAALAYGKRMWEGESCQDPVGEEDSLEGKMSKFYGLYRSLRSAGDLPVHQLILRILTETGYGNYAAALPAGERRAANLAMLQEKAIAYEKTSYKGLFHFVRYIDQLQKYDIDFGEADVAGENADVVRLMTIHKSKGLEFPVVFVSGLSKQFNQMDANEKMVLHPDLGMGIDEIQREPKRRKSCLFRTVVADFIRRENLGEELRVLYVAMTRAREKLLLTGIVSDKEKLMERCVGNALPGQPLSYRERVKASCYTEWIVPGLLSYPQKYTVDFVEPETLVQEEIEEQVGKQISYAELLEEIGKVPGERLKPIEEQFSYVYPYQQEVSKKSKYSVSELKHDSMRRKYEQQEGEAEIPDFLREDREPYVPDFAYKMPQLFGGQGHQDSSEAGGRSVSPGALRGTAMHRVMECMDFAAMAESESFSGEAAKKFVERELERMAENGDLPPEMAALVLPSMVEEFVKNPVAKRMAQAALKGNLFKEKPFVMEYEGVLVQGIIDVFWLEGERIVLLDYKTDRVETGEELTLRYREQLKLYGEALERIFSAEERPKRVEEKLLYSFRLKEVVQV